VLTLSRNVVAVSPSRSTVEDTRHERLLRASVVEHQAAIPTGESS